MRLLWSAALSLALALAAIGMVGEAVALKVSALGRGIGRVFGVGKGGSRPPG